MNKFKNGWEIIPKNNIPIDIKDVISNGVEQDTVIRIMSDLLSKAPDEVAWYFNEVHSGDAEACEDKVYAELPKEWFTVYDSSRLNDQASSGYNIIEVGYGDRKKGETTNETYDEYYVIDVFIALSLNGSYGSSALTEFFKFKIAVG
tara:strand:- start:438 stop:878 length:441 start_codon:yes stop_codon:yes gene_type:complete